MRGAIAVTGANGYLGGRIADGLAADGWDVLRLVRRPSSPDERSFDLNAPVDPATLGGVNVLVHCAYDFCALGLDDIWQSNVVGTWNLLQAARASGVGRLIALSTMSAYEGTRQIYGRVKLAIEAMTLGVGGIAVRPGLVVGARAGGMGGTLARLASLPVTPVPAGAGVQYPVHEEDLVAGICLLASVAEPPEAVVGLAHPGGVAFAELLGGIAAMTGRRPPRLVPIPARLVEGGIRIAERAGMALPLRSDSLAGLLSPAPFVPQAEYWARNGLHLRSLAELAQAPS